jgi:hypothetical protein
MMRVFVSRSVGLITQCSSARRQRWAALRISSFASTHDFIAYVIRERLGKVAELPWEILVND